MTGIQKAVTKNKKTLCKKRQIRNILKEKSYKIIVCAEIKMCYL